MPALLIHASSMLPDFHPSMTIYFMQALSGVQATNKFSFLKFGSSTIEERKKQKENKKEGKHNSKR